MIYLIYGNKDETVRDKVRSIVNAQISKKPDALQFRVTDDNWAEMNLDELLGGQALFVQKYIVIFDHLLRQKGHKEAQDYRQEQLFAKLKEFQESDHIFIFAEGELTKEVLKKFEKQAEKVQELSEVEKKEKPRFNVFALADALGQKNKKELWVLYEKALMNGAVAEEIHPILFWQVKAMLGAVRAHSAEEAGLNPFVYKKSTMFAKNFSEAELKNVASKLVTMYHDARRGFVDMEVEMERFVLGI